MFNKKYKNNSGGLMLEVLIVASIVTVAFIASLAVAQKSIQVSRQSIHASQAAFLLEEGAEAVRVLRDNAWTNITALSTSTTYYPTFTANTWTLSTTPNTIDIFNRTVELDPVYRDSSSDDILPPGGSGTLDTGTMLVNVNVSWSEGTQNKTKTLSFYINNIF